MARLLTKAGAAVIRPYAHTIEDALFLHENGATLIHILHRLGIGRDALAKAFRRTGTPQPVWRQEGK